MTFCLYIYIISSPTETLEHPREVAALDLGARESGGLDKIDKTEPLVLGDREAALRRRAIESVVMVNSHSIIATEKGWALP